MHTSGMNSPSEFLLMGSYKSQVGEPRLIWETVTVVLVGSVSFSCDIYFCDVNLLV